MTELHFRGAWRSISLCISLIYRYPVIAGAWGCMLAAIKWIAPRPSEAGGRENVNQQAVTQTGITRTSAPRSVHPEFNWAIYADATLAGLSALIPLPYIDSTFEAYFRRRMVRSIANQRSRVLHPAGLRALQQTQPSDLVKRVVALPIDLSLGMVKRISRKLIYFFSVKRAVDALTYYWRRAYLLDYMVRQGHLSSDTSAPVAVAALNSVLAQSGSGPFGWLAKQVVAGTPQVMRLLWQARRGGPMQDDALLNLRTLLAERWPEMSGYLQALSRRYDEEFANLRIVTRVPQSAGRNAFQFLEQAQEG